MGMVQEGEGRMNHPMPELAADFALEVAAVFTVVTSLVGLVATLAGVFHAPQILLCSLVVSGIYAVRVRRYRHLPGTSRASWLHLALLFAIALIFRVPAYHYVLGGQDEGLYVNIAHHIERTGGIDVRDHTYAKLKGTKYLHQYLVDNSIGPNYLAGVYKPYRGGYEKDGKLVFQFYALFPVWMAIAGGIFGSTWGSYALTFLSLVSIAFIYRIALLITSSVSAALAAGGLLALNPLHSFFSKFPVSEVPALCMALLGFTLMAAYWSSPEKQRAFRWLVLSVLAFLCLFTTRISGFMYVPFIVLLAWAALIFDHDRTRARMTNIWAIGIISVYGISICYGIIWSYPYSHDIYEMSFVPLLGERWKPIVLGGGLICLGLWIGLATVTWRHQLSMPFRERLALASRWVPVLVIWTALLLGLLKIYMLGWTPHYAHHSWLGVRWSLAQMGWRSASASSLWTMVVFVGPGIVGTFLCLLTREKDDAKLIFMHWFIAGFFAWAMLLQWVVVYTPYYSRYLLSEVVPYMILFVVCFWGRMRANKWRSAISISLALSALYATSLSAAQIGKNENEGAYASLHRLVASVGPADVILLDPSSVDPSVIKTPLLYTFDKQVATIKKSELLDSGYLATFDTLYQNVFLVASRARAPDGFSRVVDVQFLVRDFQHGHSFPWRLSTRYDLPFALYRLEHVRLSLDDTVSFANGGAGVRWLGSGWSHPERWGTWSDGRRAVMSIETRDLPQTGNGLLMDVAANVYVNAKHPVQHVVVLVGGNVTGRYVVRYPSTLLSMRIPLGCSDERAQGGPGGRIVVEFAFPDAISPNDIGLSGDTRILALGLVSARLRQKLSGGGCCQVFREER